MKKRKRTGRMEELKLEDPVTFSAHGGGGVGAAKVSITHIFASLVICTGKLLQLIKVFFTAAVLPIATGLIK